MPDVRAQMAKVDTDGSGGVDFHEFAEWFLQVESDELIELEDALAQEEILADASAEEALAEAKAAARVAEEERQRQLQERLEHIWKKVDKDRSGALDAGELKTVLVRMGRLDDIADVMQQVDADNSGDVDFAEFCAWFKKVAQAEAKALEAAIEKSLDDVATVVGSGSVRFISKLKKGQRQKRKAAFLSRLRGTHQTVDADAESAFKNVKKDKQIEIARSQLSDARTADDFHQLSAALHRARKLAYCHDEHTLHAFCDSFEQQLDVESRLKISLHNSEAVMQEIERFWVLMAFVSEAGMLDKATYWYRARAHLVDHSKVTREGYLSLHIRIAKAVHDDSRHGNWTHSRALDSAQTDWFDDVARFAGDAGVSAWCLPRETL